MNLRNVVSSDPRSRRNSNSVKDIPQVYMKRVLKHCLLYAFCFMLTLDGSVKGVEILLHASQYEVSIWGSYYTY
jgi:hypothetical protein